MVRSTKIEKAAKAIDKYLTDKDFNSRVILTVEDGSKFYINYAFYIKLAGYVIVFSEHNGIFIEPEEETTVRQINYKLKSQDEIDRLNDLAKLM